MHYPTREDIHHLLQFTGQTCISLYMPVQAMAPQGSREDMMRFKNLLEQAQDQLHEPVRSQLKASFDQARVLLQDAGFWQRQSRGLAVFIARDMMAAYSLPVPAIEAVQVDDRFYVSALVECVNQYKTLYVLAISKGSVRLLESHPEGLRDVRAAGLPAGLVDTAHYSDQGQPAGQQPQGVPASQYAAEAGFTHEPHAYLREYLLQTDAAVMAYFKRKPQPLVVTALEPVLGLYSKLTRLPKIAGKLDINPDSLSRDELHDKAWTVAAKAFPDPATAALNAYGSYQANEPRRVEDDPERIIEAARQGRVEMLLVGKPMMAPVAVAFHERIPVDNGPDALQPGRETEAAVQETYRSSGSICVVPAEELPAGTEMAAVLRY